MWKRTCDWLRRLSSAARGQADRHALLTHISQVEHLCESVQYTRLPAVGGTAHVLEVVHRGDYCKAVGRTRLEAYVKVIEHIAGDASQETG